jgi:small-conductance mechanosensitive channel
MDMTDVLEQVQNVATSPIFHINQTPISLTSLLVFAVALALFVLLARFVARILMKRIFARLHLHIGTQYTLTRLTEYILVAIGAIIAFQVIGINLSGLAVIFGLLSVGIGFGLQNVTSNFVAGLILLFERPIKIGDRVTVGDTEGDVEEINIRSTTIRSLNNISIIVPNSEFISSRVTNWSHGDLKIRMDIQVGVSYQSDLDTVLLALREAAEENPNTLETPKPEVLLDGFGDSSWNMRLRVWLRNPKRYYPIRSDINCAIVRKFRHYNVEIPFPQRDLHVRSPLPVPFAPETKESRD